MPSPFRTVYLALGANLGDRLRAIEGGLARLVARGAIRDVTVSGVYETDAVVDPGAPAHQPPYLNAVARAATSLPAADLLRACLQVEVEAGRRRAPGQHHAPRPLDVDLLLLGDEVLAEPELIVPHPRLLERPFVRIPLADVAAPGLRHPLTGTDLTRADESPGVRLWPGAARV